MFRRLLPLVSGIAVVLAVEPLAAALKPHTLEAWGRYVKLTEDRIRDEVKSADRFLLLDRKPDHERPRMRAALDAGKVEVEQLATLDLGSPFKVRDGLIHHWIGTVLVPKESVNRLLQVFLDYDRHAERFAPTVTRSRILSGSEDGFEVAMRTAVKKLNVSVVLDQELAVRIERSSPTRAFVVSRSTRITQVENEGLPTEKRTAGDAAFGWLWRINTYCLFDQRAEGTYEQCESISLTRNLPPVLAWAGPTVKTMSREALETALLQVRRSFMQ